VRPHQGGGGTQAGVGGYEEKKKEKGKKNREKERRQPSALSRSDQGIKKAKGGLPANTPKKGG